MTGPGGATTKRDERRDARRGQFQQRQKQRQVERQRQIQRQRITRIAIGVGGVILVALLLFLVIHAATGGAGSNAAPTKHAQYTSPATGETREGLSCLDGTANTGTSQHIHAYLAYYVDGKQVNITPNTGVLTNCNYAVHEHLQNPNILHIEAPNQDTYYLGDFFAIWGQHLSATQVGSNVADATHKLTFETIDANGKVTLWPSNKDPWDIPLTAHETIFILYNSPDIKPTAYTQWGDL